MRAIIGRRLVRLAPTFEQSQLERVQVHLEQAVGFGGIGLGLAVLLVGLFWSATRRLRNLPDDPGIIRSLIVLGLVVAAVGVVLGGLTVGAR